MKGVLYALLSLGSLVMARPATEKPAEQQKISCKFSQSAVTLDSFVKTVTVTLSAKPDGPVTTYLDATGKVGVDKCELKFDQNNWNKPQTIKISMFNGAKITDGNLGSVTCEPDVCKPGKDTVTVNGKTGPVKTCTVTGDPHFTTFDGAKYTMSAKGSNQHVYYVKSERLNIQTRQFECLKGAATCSDMVFISFMNAYAKITYSGSGSKNPKDYKIQITTSAASNALTQAKAGDNSYNFRTSDGGIIQVSLKAYLHKVGQFVVYFNVITTLPSSYMNTVSGACGNFDGKPANDCNSYDSCKAYIPSNENCFDNPHALKDMLLVSSQCPAYTMKATCPTHTPPSTHNSTSVASTSHSSVYTSPTSNSTTSVQSTSSHPSPTPNTSSGGHTTPASTSTHPSSVYTSPGSTGTNPSSTSTHPSPTSVYTSPGSPTTSVNPTSSSPMPSPTTSGPSSTPCPPGSEQSSQKYKRETYDPACVGKFTGCSAMSAEEIDGWTWQCAAELAISSPDDIGAYVQGLVDSFNMACQARSEISGASVNPAFQFKPLSNVTDDQPVDTPPSGSGVLSVGFTTLVMSAFIFLF